MQPYAEQLREEAKRAIIVAALEVAPTITAAAKELRMNRQNMHRLMRELGVERRQAEPQSVGDGFWC